MQSSILRQSASSLLIFCAIAMLFRPSPAMGEAAAPDWIYMDLGEVIVTGNPTAGYRFLPGALEFLDELHASGLKVALITNIPESWGARCTAKVDNLKEFLQARIHGEDATYLSRVLWPRFDAVIVPPFDRYRKPQSLMFVQGLANACPGRALYLGENAAEIALATRLGYATRLMGKEVPKVSELLHLLDANFNQVHPANCEYRSQLDDVLQPDDQGVVTGCIVAP